MEWVDERKAGDHVVTEKSLRGEGNMDGGVQSRGCTVVRHFGRDGWGTSGGINKRDQRETNDTSMDSILRNLFRVDR